VSEDACGPDGPLPEGIRGGPPAGARVVALAHPPEERERAARLLVWTAGVWARCGHRVVAADLHLDQPILHEAAGIPNLEGVTDIFLYGASVARSARPVPEGGFYLISAGTYASDPREVLDAERWRRLADGFRDTDAVLLALVPQSLAAEGPAPDWVDGWIVAGDPEHPSSADARILARYDEVDRREEERRLDQAELPVEEDEREPGSEEAAEREQLSGVPVQPDQRAAASALSGEEDFLEEDVVEPAWGHEDSPRGPAVESRVSGLDEALQTPSSGEGEETVPPPASASTVGETARRRRRSRGRGGRLFLWLLVIVLVLVAATVVLWVLRPDVLSPLGLGVLPGGGVAAVVPPSDELPAGVEPESDPIPYSVEIRNYASSRAAREHLNAERARFDEASFYISPILDRGVLYYRLLAGPVADTAEAAALRGTLMERGIVTAAGGAAREDRIEPTPLAFDLGLRGTESSARALEDSLAERGIPGYVVPVRYSDGRERWRVYGGAFPDSMRAGAMSRMLEEADLSAPLVERVGRSAAEGG